MTPSSGPDNQTLEWLYIPCGDFHPGKQKDLRLSASKSQIKSVALSRPKNFFLSIRDALADLRLESFFNSEQTKGIVNTSRFTKGGCQNRWFY